MSLNRPHFTGVFVRARAKRLYRTAALSPYAPRRFVKPTSNSSNSTYFTASIIGAARSQRTIFTQLLPDPVYRVQLLASLAGCGMTLLQLAEHNLDEHIPERRKLIIREIYWAISFTNSSILTLHLSSAHTLRSVLTHFFLPTPTMDSASIPIFQTRNAGATKIASNFLILFFV